MPPVRRSYNTRARFAKRTGRTGYANIVRKRPRRTAPTVATRVNQLYRMIETKETTRTVRNVNITHNNIGVLNINPFLNGNVSDDPMSQNTGSRVGDQINVRGLLVKAFLQNQDQRAKVFFRIMLVRSAKGDTPTRATLFRNCSDNKMIDLINTERFTIMAQKTFNVTSSNNVASSVTVTTGVPATATVGGIGTRTFNMWIPGVKFGRQGRVTYENGSNGQVKFFDHHVVVLCYDWYQTFQDSNNVGFVNECYTKLYFKDA